MGERGVSFKILIFMNYIDYHFNFLLYFDILSYISIAKTKYTRIKQIALHILRFNQL